MLNITRTFILSAVLSTAVVSAQSETIPNLNQTPNSFNANNTEQQISIQEKAAGDCNIGNENDAGATNTTGNFLANYISGVKYTLAQEGTLNSINIITQTTGQANIIMTVYDDLNGVPNNLIVQSASAPVIIGTVTLPVTPVVLTAGDYWVMVSFDVTGQHVKRIPLTGNQGYYTSLPFGSPAPTNASSFIQTTPNVDQLYFLDITCTSSIGLNELNDKVAAIYPNPTSDKVTVELNESVFMDKIELIDGSGRTVKSFNINQSINSKTLNVSDVLPGMYSLRIASIDQTIIKSIVIE